MKKLIVALMAMAVVASADGFVVGTELNYGKVDSDLSASAGGVSASASDDTKTIGFAVKGGYEFDAIRVLGVITSEKYKDDMITNNDGNAVSIGAEVDYMIENVFIGATLSTGEKDFDGTDIDFTDIGVRLGGAFELGTDANLEAGVYYKKRDYDSYVWDGVTLDLDDKIIGVFVGVSFNL